MATSVPMLLQTGDRRCAARALAQHGNCALLGGDTATARARFLEAWALAVAVDEPGAMAECLYGLGELSDGTVAVKLYARAAVTRPQTPFNCPVSGIDPTVHLSGLRSTLGDEAFSQAWEEGVAQDPAPLIAMLEVTET